MNITKGELRKFIEHKIAEQMYETHNQIEKLVDAKLDPILEKYVQTGKVEQLASKLVDELNTVIENYKHVVSEWHYHRVVQYVSSAQVIEKEVKEAIKNEVRTYIRKPHYKALDLQDKALNQAAKELRLQSQSLYKKLDDLSKLQDEIEQVIKNEANGKRAYKALVALGVNLEGLEEKSANLPAVVKLSVNPCVLNGDCEDAKEASQATT